MNSVFEEEQYREAESLFFSGNYHDAYAISIKRCLSQKPNFLRLLGWLCYVDESPNYNLDAAEKWFKKAIDLGDVDAIHQLGGVYLKKDDLKNAIKYFRIGAEREYPPSLCRLGIFYKEGLIVKKDKIKALAYLKKSAQAGNIVADKERLNLLLYSGSSIVKKSTALFSLILLSIKTFITVYKKGKHCIELQW